MSKVVFLGAGPGDPELLTIKGRRLLDAADVIIYAGSLVNKKLLDGVRAEVHDSASLDLDRIIALMTDAVAQGKTVVRLHTGDPAFYSAISEQIERLRPLGIAYEVVPGVSSAMAGAAALGQELTIPEVSQTVIFTRCEGRTPVPETEQLRDLARHRASMIIFLSAGMAEKVREELLTAYPPETPVAVVEKASWPEQRIVRGVLGDLAALLKDNDITKTALIYVGDALKASMGPTGMTSKLYDKDFTHEYRTP
jgi:precorrin-4/cobalt-precorrin-4 C11-methyltransferase